MKDYKIRIEKLEVLGTVTSLLEYQLDSEADYLKHCLDLAEENGCNEYYQENVEKYTIRVKTMQELLNFLNSDNKNLPWNK